MPRLLPVTTEVDDHGEFPHSVRDAGGVVYRAAKAEDVQRWVAAREKWPATGFSHAHKSRYLDHVPGQLVFRKGGNSYGVDWTPPEEGSLPKPWEQRYVLWDPKAQAVVVEGTLQQLDDCCGLSITLPGWEESQEDATELDWQQHAAERGWLMFKQMPVPQVEF